MFKSFFATEEQPDPVETLALAQANFILLERMRDLLRQGLEGARTNNVSHLTMISATQH
jgi:hypothetical protein